MEEFIPKYKDKYAKVLLGALPLPKEFAPRHSDPDVLINFDYYWTALQHAHSLGYKRGLDFGCGNCSAIIIGELLGIQMTGIDIAEVKSRTMPLFKGIQESAQKEGYDIRLFDTEVVPWCFDDDEFDFVLCWQSLLADWRIEHIFWRDNIFRCMPRLLEMDRILNSHGLLYIGSDVGDAEQDIYYVKKLYSYLTNGVTPTTYNWKRNTVEPLI